MAMAKYNGLMSLISKNVSRSPECNKNQGYNQMNIQVKRSNSGNNKKVNLPSSVGKNTLQNIEIVRETSDCDDSSVEVETTPKVSFAKQTRPPAFQSNDMEDFVNQQKRVPRGVDDENSYDETESDNSSKSSMESDEISEISSIQSEMEMDSSKLRKKQKKYELLSKLHQLERRGVALSRSFTVKTKLIDLQFEYDRITKELNTESGLKFGRKILMAAVTGLEYVNKRFDPVQAKLEGWSESVMENMDDYDKPLIRLVEKYGKSVEMAPELELLMALAGSGFMFHLSKSILQNPVSILNSMGQENPEMLESVMKNVMNSIRPDQLKQFEPMEQNRAQKDMSPPSLKIDSDSDSDDTGSEYTNDSSDDDNIKFVPMKNKKR